MRRFQTNPDVQFILLRSKSWYAAGAGIEEALRLGKPGVVVLRLLLFCAVPRSVAEIEEWLSIDSSLGNREELFIKLREAKLVKPVPVRKVITAFSSSFDLQQYVGTTSRREFADYSDPKVLPTDIRESRDRVSKEGPFLTRPYEVAFRICLASPFNVSRLHPSTFNNISLLLFLSFGYVEQRRFADSYDVFLSTSPSNGSRQPFRVALHIPETADFPRGLYIYDPVENVLNFVTTGQPPDTAKAISSNLPRLFVFFDFESEQWRYADSWYYRVMLIELGHRLQVLHHVARHLNFTLLEVASNRDESFWIKLGFEPFSLAVEFRLG